MFFLNDPAPTEIYTLSLHDALPICVDPDGLALGSDELGELLRRVAEAAADVDHAPAGWRWVQRHREVAVRDRKSTRLNSSHANISYAVFCLKKKSRDHETRCPSTG